jgi:hypothetical protein
MKFHILAVLVLPAGIVPPRVQAQITDRIVVIRSDLGQGRVGIGTGFFISPKGRVLTAYHVIQGARQLTVTNQGVPYPDVVIELISPERDLATLVVGPLKGATPFLQLSPVLPTGVENETLRMVGHPDGNLYLSLDTRMTAPGFSSSGTIRVSGQQPVFRLNDVDMIRLAGIVRNGMSGAPVVSSRGVIGVLSGSGEEGGSLAWAIPAKYVKDPTMRAVNKRAREMTRWDELTLMISRWKNLRHSVRMDDRVATGLNDLFDAVERVRVGYEQLIESIENSLATVKVVRALAEERVRQHQEFGARDSVLTDRLTERLTAVVTSGNDWMQGRTRATSKLIELELLLAGYQGALPKTQHNDSLVAGFGAQMKALEHRLVVGDTAYRLTLDRITRGLVSVLPTLTTVPETPAGMVTALVELEKILISIANEQARLAVGAESHLIGETAAFLERMLTADYDDNDTDWRWASGLGYDLMIPARWEKMGAESEEAIAPVTAGMRNEGFTLDAVFGRAFGVATDTANGASMLVVGRTLAPVPRAAFDSLARGAETQARRTGMEFERIHTPEIDAMITRGVVVSGQRRTLRCVAVIFGPTRPLGVILTLPPDRHELLPRCKAIVESATFR